MNGTFTISSGPFDVPLVEHVIIVKGNCDSEVRWKWELLRGDLYFAFPIMAKCSCTYTMAEAYDRESRMSVLNVLVFLRCDPEVLKDICKRLGGEYL